MKLTRCRIKGKKQGGKKRGKKGEERKRKVKVKSCFLRLPGCMHLDQKAAKCTTCNRVYGKFWLFIARQ